MWSRHLTIGCSQDDATCHRPVLRLPAKRQESPEIDNKMVVNCARGQARAGID